MLVFVPQLPPLQGLNLQPQRIQPDKATGFGLGVDRILLEGSEALLIQRVRRLPPHRGAVTLVQLQPHYAAYRGLSGVHGTLQESHLRREPEAVVAELGLALHQAVANLHHLAIQ